MKLLLDTNVFFWLMNEPARVRRHIDALEDPTNDLLVSSASAWEIAIKYARGKLPLPQPPATYVWTSMLAIGAQPVPVTHDHALGVAVLPPIHRDPFDRLLVAQALALQATIVTGDAVLAGYPAQTLLV